MNGYTKKIILELPVQVKVVFCGERQVVLNCLVSTMIAFHMIKCNIPDLETLAFICMHSVDQNPRGDMQYMLVLWS